jgi:peptidoglycan/LPS O-acetylase OafA/YrhL
MIPRGPGPVVSIEPTKTPPKSRLHDLPIAAFRGVVCLGIVAAHFYVARPMLGPVADWAIVNVRFGFESFFILAGFFLAHSFRPGEWNVLSLSAYFRRRLLRLAAPYWVAIAAGILGFGLSAAIRGREYAWPAFGDVWPLLLFVQDLFPASLPSAPYWFMAPLFQFYLVWGLGFWLARRAYLSRGREDYHNRAVRVMVVVTGLAMFASIAARASGIEFRWELVRNGVYLAMGCLTCWAAQGLRARWWLAAGWVTACAVGLSAGGSRSVAACLASAVLLWMSVARPRLPDWWVLRGLGFVGERSYSIYLTHTYIGYRMLNLPTVWAGAGTPLMEVGVWLAAVAASVVFGCAFFWLVERPLARLSRSVRYRAKWETPEPARAAPAHPGVNGQATRERDDVRSVRMI